MAVTPTLPQNDPNTAQRQAKLQDVAAGYQYRAPGDNQLFPIATAAKYPIVREEYGLTWVVPFLPGYLKAWTNRFLKGIRFGLQRLLLRFDKMKAYEQAFPGAVPGFVALANSDEAFAYWRIAGPNSIGLVQETNLPDLLQRIPLDVAMVEERLNERLNPPVTLAAEAAAGRLFVVDFELIHDSQRPVGHERDSRWREKYLPAPIGVFLEAPGFYPNCDLVPLAVQIDPLQPSQLNPPPLPQKPEHNPVYYPSDRPLTDGSEEAEEFLPDDYDPMQHWGWRIAKAYFEVADTSYHVACGHVYRTHLLLEPFGLATPRNLSSEHPVYILLRPHLRYTLATNKAAYKYFIDRRDTYFEFYAGTLEETRQIAIESYEATDFRSLQLEAELEGRGVSTQPLDYPYREDAKLWLRPIRDFVTSYVELFYDGDGDVLADTELQSWAAELMSDDFGRIKNLVAADALDTRAKLIDVLAQVLFTAGPGHASQQFSSNHYYRYSPAFPGAAYAPPVWEADRAHEARFRNTLPPIKPAVTQLTYNSFTNYKFDRFGDYHRYPLGDVAAAAPAIAQLQQALSEVETIILARQPARLLPFEFLLPSQVPNSINI